VTIVAGLRSGLVVLLYRQLHSWTAKSAALRHLGVLETTGVWVLSTLDSAEFIDEIGVDFIFDNFSDFEIGWFDLFADLVVGLTQSKTFALSWLTHFLLLILVTDEGFDAIRGFGGRLGQIGVGFDLGVLEEVAIVFQSLHDFFEVDVFFDVFVVVGRIEHQTMSFLLEYVLTGSSDGDAQLVETTPDGLAVLVALQMQSQLLALTHSVQDPHWLHSLLLQIPHNGLPVFSFLQPQN
jgi:hypothetical protein